MFFPGMKFTIRSCRTPEEIRARLQSVTACRENGLSFSIDKDFRGTVGDVNFKLLPILGKGFTFYVKDSFLPVIVGEIRRTRTGTAIAVKMRLLWPVFAFLVVWFGIAGCAFLAGLLAAVTGAGMRTAAGPAGMILAGQLIVRIGFYLPAKMARQKLEALFKM